MQTPGALSYVAPYNVAIVYAGLGGTSQSFAWLERAFRSYYLPTFFPTDERLDNLRADPRFTELKRRLDLPQVTAFRADHGLHGRRQSENLSFLVADQPSTDMPTLAF